MSASTSHRSTALNAASSCNDNDEADAHSRHSTHLDRRIVYNCICHSTSTMRSIILNLSRAEILIPTVYIKLCLSEHVISLNDKTTLSGVLFCSQFIIYKYVHLSIILYCTVKSFVHICVKIPILVKILNISECNLT